MKTTQPSQPATSASAAPGRTTMQAIVQHHYGTRPEDVLRLEQVATPAIAANEVLVQVRAAAVDRGTWHLMAGQPYLMRLLGFGLRGPKSPVPGLDVAGTVVATGACITGFRAADEVFGIARGSFAEYAAAQADKLVRKPGSLSFEQAAAVAVSGLAALQGLRAGHIQAGRRSWSLAPQEASAATPCNWPRPSERKSPASAARGRRIWSARSAPTMSSTTPKTISPTAAGTTT
jgi:D-arabinose 1-dehydrogenase-like Zn-dependent alcohol dehydrogenase